MLISKYEIGRAEKRLNNIGFDLARHGKDLSRRNKHNVTALRIIVSKKFLFSFFFSETNLGNKSLRGRDESDGSRENDPLLQRGVGMRRLHKLGGERKKNLLAIARQRNVYSAYFGAREHRMRDKSVVAVVVHNKLLTI
jgi:hypothetical protein